MDNSQNPWNTLPQLNVSDLKVGEQYIMMMSDNMYYPHLGSYRIEVITPIDTEAATTEVKILETYFDDDCGYDQHEVRVGYVVSNNELNETPDADDQRIYQITPETLAFAQSW